MYLMSCSTAKASISGSSVVPGLPNMTLMPSCFRRSRKARFPDITGKFLSPRLTIQTFSGYPMIARVLRHNLAIAKHAADAGLATKLFVAVSAEDGGWPRQVPRGPLHDVEEIINGGRQRNVAAGDDDDGDAGKLFLDRNGAQQLRGDR